MYGQTGLPLKKIVELQDFIELHKIDVICLQETDIQEKTFSGSKLLDKFVVFANNNRSRYGTCTLVKNNLQVHNIVKDADGRLISVDVNDMSIVNVYPISGTDQESKTEREAMIDNIPNLLMYKNKNGVIGGDFNCITEKKDATNNPDQKMSECLKKLIKLYGLKDAYRQLYPHSKQYSRYYISKGVKGATRIDRAYVWGNVKVREAEYVGTSFSDHYSHVVTIENPAFYQEKDKRNSIYKIKHFIVDDKVFQESVEQAFPDWLETKEGLCPVFWWENVVKPGIRTLAITREKEINKQRRMELEALQMKLSFYVKKVRNSIDNDEEFVHMLAKYEDAKRNLQKFYHDRAKIILYQNKAEEFDMSDTTKIYHFESLNNYVKSSKIDKLEVDGKIFNGHENIENIINEKLTDTMSQKFSLDEEVCEKLFSFEVPKISDDMNQLLVKEITMSELLTALKQMKPKASPGIDGIPSTFYVKMSKLIAPYMLEVINEIVQGKEPSESMRTSTLMFLGKPKKMNSIKFEDKRKISVLCTDFKCIETIMTNRLNVVMQQYITPSQYACKPKKIQHGLAAARDVVNYASKKKIGMACVALDMKSGFDFLQMDFVYYCFKKYGFTDEAINIFKNIYSKALATLVLNGKPSKVLKDLRECLRQGGCGSMGIFCSGVNPLLQLLEHKLEGITIYEAPLLGPVSENEKTIHGIKKNEKVIGYVDDIAPYITKKEEFTILDESLITFERASGCKFHRDQNSQKCKVMPIGPWKKWLTQDKVPLPFLRVTDHLEILGAKFFESWSKTKNYIGENLVETVKNKANRWKGGRFYELTQKPHIVNTWLFSNLWYNASVIDLKCGDMDKIQQYGNNYVFKGSGTPRRPEKEVNYIDKKDGGLQITHIRAKCNALLIKYLLLESETNCYINAVIRRYVMNEEVVPKPIEPPYMTKSVIANIRVVLQETSSRETNVIYRILLQKELNIDEDFKLKTETKNENFDLTNAMRLVNSKVISLHARNFLWKHMHRIFMYEWEDKTNKGRIACKSCELENIGIDHLFKCDMLNDVGNKLVKVLKVFDPGIKHEEILALNLSVGHLQADWLLSNMLYFIANNRRRCNLENCLAFLLSEFEVLKRSKFCNEELELSVQITIELLNNENNM